jgi:hypothetical protein
MASIGYARLIEQFSLRVRPLDAPASTSGSVNQRVNAHDRILFPRNVSIDDSPVGHLEFALRHEGVNLEVIDAAFEHISPTDLSSRLKVAPTGVQIRRACHLWEWLTGRDLPTEGFAATGGYVDLFPRDTYVTSEKPVNKPKFRVRDNALGTADFCPIVRLSALPQTPSLIELVDEASRTLGTLSDPALYERAVNYLNLSETRSSFAIEREQPSSEKQERFIQLLRRAGEPAVVDEDWLVGLQNTVVRDVFSQEASYRTTQNWLEDATGRITFFPPPPDDLRRLMDGWEAFVGEHGRCADVLVKAACAAFGFVYIHPFLDGNGRLHRFLIQHVLARSVPLPGGAIVPVSAVILKNIPDYLGVLTGFSRPVTKMWRYTPGDAGPMVTEASASRAYRFFDASREVAFLHRIIQLAVQEEIPRELAWLSGYDAAFQQIDAEFDLPQKDISALIRMIHSNQGTISSNRRKQFNHVPVDVLNRIQGIVREAFSVGGSNRAP